ncbi:hypothetical protein [Methanogenium cariaci]|uniref:hypothetical protein n=1 Tax=Methanogenium cariaci TaxID=2197 RepID=UPI001FDEAB00|nr:hypothetical protein [Methanogenium cariaci]
MPRFFGRDIRSRPLDEILAEVQAFKDAGATRLSVSGGTGSLYGYADGKLNDEAFAELLRGMAEIMGRRTSHPPLTSGWTVSLTPSLMPSVTTPSAGFSSVWSRAATGCCA